MPLNRRQVERRRSAAVAARAATAAFAPCFLAMGAWAQTPTLPVHATFPRPAQSVVPIEVKYGMLYVKAQVNGKPALFYLDSLWGTDAITSDAAKRLGVLPDTPDAAATSQQTVRRLQIGSFVLENEPVAVLPSDGWQVDGLLGAGLLNSAVVRVDLKNQRLAFLDPTTYAPPPGATSLPLQIQRDGSALVVGRIDGLEGKFALEAGNGRALDLEPTFVTRMRIRELYADGIRPGNPDEIRAQNFQLGPFRIASPIVQVPKPNGSDYRSNSALDGRIGSQIFQRFVATFDYPHQRLILESPDPMVHTVKGDGAGGDAADDAPEHDTPALMDARLLLSDYQKQFSQIQWAHGTAAAYDQLSQPDLKVTLRPFGAVAEVLDRTQFLEIFHNSLPDHFGQIALATLVVDNSSDYPTPTHYVGLPLVRWRPDRIEVGANEVVVYTSPSTDEEDANDDSANPRPARPAPVAPPAAAAIDDKLHMKATFRNVFAKTDNGLRLKSIDMVGLAINVQGKPMPGAEMRRVFAQPINVAAPQTLPSAVTRQP